LQNRGCKIDDPDLAYHVSAARCLIVSRYTHPSSANPQTKRSDQERHESARLRNIPPMRIRRNTLFRPHCTCRATSNLQTTTTTPRMPWASLTKLHLIWQAQSLRGGICTGAANSTPRICRPHDRELPDRRLHRIRRGATSCRIDCQASALLHLNPSKPTRVETPCMDGCNQTNSKT